MNVMSPVNLLESVPPNVSSPLVLESEVVGWKDIPITSVGMEPCANRLSVMVGTVSASVVPSVRSTGPILHAIEYFSSETNG